MILEINTLCRWSSIMLKIQIKKEKLSDTSIHNIKKSYSNFNLHYVHLAIKTHVLLIVFFSKFHFNFLKMKKIILFLYAPKEIEKRLMEYTNIHAHKHMNQLV